VHLDRCTRTGLTRATAGPFSFRGLPSADNVPLLQETHKASRDFYRKYGWFRPGAARFVPGSARADTVTSSCDSLAEITC
jgi:hypothetical protein